MEVSPGYKQTEVGVIPEDWEVKPVGRISDVKTGPFGSALHERDYVEDGTPIITVEHLGERGVIHNNLPMVSDKDKARLNGYILKTDDIVFSRVGSVDRNALVKENENGWLFSGRLLRVRLTDDHIDPSYLSYHFHTRDFKQRVLDVAVGQTMASINTQILKSINTVLPKTRKEQEVISCALHDVDGLIESLEHLIAKKRAVKQGAMQELLTGRRRLPGFSGEWEVTSLRKLGFTYGGITGKTKSDFDHGISRYIPFLNILNNVAINLDQLDIVDIGSNEYQNKVMAGDLFFNGSSETPEEVGMCAVLIDHVEGVYLNSFCFGFRFYNDNTVNGLYLAYFFRSGEGRKLLYSLAQGATRHNLSKLALLALEFRMPTKEEQLAIANLMNDMDIEISALEEKLIKAQQIKQGMMQELLTGRIRLV